MPGWALWPSSPAKISFSVSSSSESQAQNGEQSIRLRRSNPPSESQNWPAVTSERYRNLGLQLYTTGTYAVRPEPGIRLPSGFEEGNTQKIHHRLFNHVDDQMAWKPWLSGSWGCLTHLLVLLLAVICHVVLVIQVRQHQHSLEIGSLVPPLIGVVLARVTLFITAQELRRTMSQFPGLSSTAQTHERHLHMSTLVTILLVCPLVSHPIHLVAKQGLEEWEPKDGYSRIPLDVIVRSMPVDLPKAIQGSDYHQTDDRFASEGRMTSWSTSLEPLWEILPTSRGWPQQVHVNEDSQWRSRWLRGWFNTSYALSQPIFPSRKTLPNFPLSVRWQNPGQDTLYGWMRCDQIKSNISRTANALSQEMLFEVRMVDDEGCGAEFTISSAYLSKKQRRRLQDSVMEYRSIIRSHEDEWKTDFFLAPRIESFRSRLHQYHDLLADNAVVLSTVAPKWSSAEALGPESKIGNCSGRYFLSLSPDPFSVNIDSDTPKIDTASCTTHFGMPRLTSDSLLGIWGDYFKFFTQVWKHPFQTRRQNGREIDLVIGHDPIFEGPSLDLVSFHHLPAIFRELHDDDDITVPEPPLMQAINETFTRILPKIDVFEPWHPFQLLEYEFLANFVSEQYNDHAIAFASDSFMSAMFQRLHVAAQLLPRDDFKYPSDDFEHHVIYLTDWMPTLSIFFQLVLWISIITVLPLIFVRQILADRSRSNLPWPVSSIASRAILLCQSRLPKVFEQIGRVPEDLRGLHPIRIGQWRCSERNQAQPDTNWRVDSLLNECILPLPGQPHRVFHKHSFSSIPLCANPLIVFLLLTVLLLTWKATLSVSSGIIRKDVESLSDYSSIIPLALGTKWAIDRPFWSMRMISSIPIFLSFAITTYWWDRITSFYKGRLPWANLWKPAYAQRAITLDYQNCRFPFFLALKNRHWMLATLLFGSFILVPSPILAAYVYNFKWVLQSAEPVAATKSSTWRASLNSPETPLVFRSILQHTFIRWGNTSAVPKWSSHRESLIPIEWESSAIGASYLPEGYVGYWRVETESLRAELQCTNLTHVSRDDTMVLTAELFGDYTTANGSEEIDLDPCSGVATDTDHRDDSICSRWQLMDLKSTTVSLEPVWIISAANYTKGTSGPTGVLLCIPKIFVGKGTAELLSNGSLNDAAIHRYTPISEAELDEGSAARDFSRLLNHSVFTPDTDSQNNPWYDRPLGLMFSSPLITTPQFRGDILSFLQYKDVYRNRLPLFDYEIFASTASEVFSALVSTAADSTLLFRTAIVNETIPIRPLKWRQVPSPVAAKISVAYTLFVAIVMAAHIIIILTSKKYRFPIAPEPLENSLFLLYRSTIPSLLETKIPHPELQSLSTFHSRVHQLQLRYMLGRGKDNASFSSLRVDVASPVLAEYVEESDDNNDREPIMRAYRRSWRSGVQAGKNFVSAWKRGWRRGSRVQVRDIFQHRAVRWVTWPLKAVIEAGDFVGGLSARFPRRRRASWDSDYRDDYDHHELERLLDEE